MDSTATNRRVNRLEDFELAGKRLLIREDLNVPVQGGKITSDIRLRAAIPTLNRVLKAGAEVILMSHYGGAQEGQYNADHSLEPIASRLSQLLGMPIPVIKHWRDTPIEFGASPIVMLENVRFNPGEKNNDPELSKAYAGLADIFVMDAFGTAHRTQASTAGVAQYSRHCCAGPLLINETESLDKILSHPSKPLLAIVGGDKVSSKLAVLARLSIIVDDLVVGGGIANTFLAAKGFPVGGSLYEPNLIETAAKIMQNCKVLLPVDVYVADTISPVAQPILKSVNAVSDTDIILDIGAESQKRQGDTIARSSTLLWNGPVGVFELPQFASGTQTLATAIAESDAFSVAGGGSTLAAIEQFQVTRHISYISTGGGAFIQYIEGDQLPAILALQQNNHNL